MVSEEKSKTWYNSKVKRFAKRRDSLEGQGTKVQTLYRDDSNQELSQ